MEQLRLRLVDDGHVDDIEVTIDSAATVGDLTRRLHRSPVPIDGQLGLALEVDSSAARVVGPEVSIGDSGLRSGLAVALTSRAATDGDLEVIATLVVHAGPDAPLRFPLRRGTTTIGRGPGCTVRLSDPMVSKHHARVHIDDTVEVVDDGSVNGIVMGGSIVDRATLLDADRVVLGNTELSVVAQPIESHTGNTIGFNRCPRVDPRYEGVELVAPEPPRPPSPPRFPVFSLLVPIAMAAMIYAVTRSTLAILFVGLSPLMMVGSWFETRRANAKQMTTETARFRAALDDLGVQLVYVLEQEQIGRRREHPGATLLAAAVYERDPLLWTRRPEHDSFGVVRLGLGTRRSRHHVRMPNTNATVPELWSALSEVVAAHADVADVPVVADLGECGNVGVGGPAEAAVPVMRGIIAQLVGLHAPSELVVAAIGAGRSGRWDWLAWLPHVDPAGSPLAARHLAANAVETTALVDALDALVEERADRRGPTDRGRVLPAVIVLVDGDTVAIDRARLVQLAEHGPREGIHLLWCASSVSELPAACRAFVGVRSGAMHASAGLVVDGDEIDPLETEVFSADEIVRFGRALSPVVDSGAVAATDGGLPASASLLDLAGHELASDPASVVELWRQSSSAVHETSATGVVGGGLRALVGCTSDGPVHLDLRTQGPHALVGGTTGSGKSEFLQSWILGLATMHSPDRLSFLFVDYKGGAAFAECVDLPHCVGLVTDLGPHLVRRALTSLEAEVRRREQLLNERGAKDLIELERSGAPGCPPSLVIMIDEFAALTVDVPEFVDGVVNIAQRGRSLGLHLVLATQRPAGVVTDNVRANTNLRVALRMADEADSVDVIGRPDAAAFDPSHPGRAIVKAGPGRITALQSAYVGGISDPARRRPITVRSIGFGTGTSWPDCGADDRDHGQTPRSRTSDIEQLVANVAAAARRLGLPAAPRPWLPELAPSYRLEALPTERTDRRLVFGVGDDPRRQTQPEVAFVPDSDGNMVVLGTGGTGKTTFLRSVAVAAAMAPARGGPCWVYALDFASRGLRSLDVLPHVGSVVLGTDHERVARLIRHLDELIVERAERYSSVDADTVDDYRRRAAEPGEPRIILLVDGLGAFRSEYEGTHVNAWWERFITIANEGRAVGVHLVLACDRPANLPPAVASTIQRRLVLRLANELDYAMVDVPADAFDASTPPGRGFLDGCQVQVATIGGHRDGADQAADMRRLAASMERAHAVAAPAIGALPSWVSSADLPDTVDGHPTLGLADDDLAPVSFEASGTFLVAGPTRSGRSTTVVALARSFLRSHGPRECVLLGARRSSVVDRLDWDVAVHGPTEIERAARQTVDRLTDDPNRLLVVVIESIDSLLNTEADLAVQQLVAVARDHDAFVIAEGDTSGLGGSWPLLQSVKAARSGIVLQPDQVDGETLFKVPFPRTNRAEFPPGRGLMVQGGRVRKVQVAMPT